MQEKFAEELSFLGAMIVTLSKTGASVAAALSMCLERYSYLEESSEPALVRYKPGQDDGQKVNP